MKVLYAASEAVPFCKTGGLADVAGSLPPALAAEGVETAVILPLYESVKQRYGAELQYPWSGRGSRGISWTTSSISAVPGSTATPTTGSGLDSSPGRW